MRDACNSKYSHLAYYRLQSIQKHLDQPINPPATVMYATYATASTGHVSLLKILLPDLPPLKSSRKRSANQMHRLHMLYNPSEL